ncbi:phage tail sheath subtilisin-like domain-containing protein [Afifella pfennigii]|uniref:phage tail sheath subtilisin-like domain-containing protein n=1 Tax=Afifella pfennigii TaxID=209897 RepID=UPI00047E46ED|nr:phage tail sheath subtilisin-like domain-containing protein [Afifella pfennigii]
MFTFDEIPYDWLEPGNYLEVTPNYRNAGIFPYPVRAHIVGQKLATGTLAPGQVVEVVRPEQAIALFGEGSIGAEQVAAFRKINKTSPLYVQALADADAAVKASGTFAFAGAVSAAVVLRFRVAGKQVRFTAAATDTLAQMATKLAAAIMAETGLTVTAAAADEVVTVTCRHGGEVGNDIDLRVDVAAQPLPSGLTVTVTPMSGGSGNPDLQDALDVIENDWFTHIQHPWNDATNMAAFAVDLARRYQAMSKLDAHGFVGKRGTFGELGTWGELTNSPFLTCAGLSKPKSSSWILSAVCCGLAAVHLTNDPARQLRSLALNGFEGPDPVDQFTETEQELLLRKGVATFDHLSDGTTVVSRMVTTYKESNLGVADRAWLDIMVPATMSRIRYDWSVYVSLLYPRAKLLDDEDSAAFVGRTDESDEDAGNSVVTPRRMHASWAARCRLYGNRAWIENVERTVKESQFARSEDDKNRLESRQQVVIVGNLMVLAGSLEFQV